MKTASKLAVGILGSTGAVGQRLVALLTDHPWFEVRSLFASGRSAGRPYRAGVTWRVPVPQPEYTDGLVIQPSEPQDELALVFSALPRESALRIEPQFARAGIPVISNASAFRMTPDVPLVIPEVNPDHTGLIAVQRKARGWDGYIVANPNCAVIGLTLPLKPLHDAYGIGQVQVVTLQALSGAGYPGPPPEVMEDNVLPTIAGEEDKLESEPRKLLGALDDDTIQLADVTISAQCNRVNVQDGHLESVTVALKSRPDLNELARVLREFKGLPQTAGLPSAPDEVIRVVDWEDRPQPKLDRDTGRGMTVTVGRIRPSRLYDIKFTVLSHNTIRGAAGAAILNAELLKYQGYL